MNGSLSGVSRGARTKESKHVCNVVTISAQLETRTKESKHVCKFFTFFTNLEPTVKGGGLWFACEGTGVSTGGRARSSAPFFYGTDQRVHDVCTMF